MALKGRVNRDIIIKKISETLEIPESEAALAVDSQFAMVAKTFKEGDFVAARLPFLGQWKVKPSRLKWFEQRRKEAAKKDED